MKNLLNLGKVISKAEQKAVFGGNRRHECDPGSGSPSGVYLGKKCQCWRDGGEWNEDDNCCIVWHEMLPGFYEATPCN